MEARLAKENVALWTIGVLAGPGAWWPTPCTARVRTPRAGLGLGSRDMSGATSLPGGDRARARGPNAVGRPAALGYCPRASYRTGGWADAGMETAARVPSRRSHAPFARSPGGRPRADPAEPPTPAHHLRLRLRPSRLVRRRGAWRHPLRLPPGPRRGPHARPPAGARRARGVRARGLGVRLPARDRPPGGGGSGRRHGTARARPARPGTVVRWARQRASRMGPRRPGRRDP